MRKLADPRFIRPETVEIGDTVRVTYPVNGGIEVSKVGTVASREDHGNLRIYLTAEGGHLFDWQPHTTRHVRVTLLARNPPASGETLFDMPMADIGEIRQRIS